MNFVAKLAKFNRWLTVAVPGYMILLAVGIGFLGGYGAVAFRLFIPFLQRQFWRIGNPDIAWVESLPWYWVVAAPTVGAAIVYFIVQRFAPEAKGHGVPEVMEAVALRQGVMRPRVVLAKAAASGVCIASGGSVGREGPIVQIGAAIGSTVGQLLQVGPRRLRTLAGCGTAAGIAATFNAPVAGALFAVEVVLGDFAVPQFSPIVISSVAATVISRHHLGNVPAFEIPRHGLESPLELIAYLLLGLLAGLLAFGFVKALYFSEDRCEATRLPGLVVACLGGAAVGGIALIYPGVLGVGYESMNQALVGSPSLALLAGLLLAKLLAVCITLGSGGSGGVFAPSLFLGSMLGGLVGLLVNLQFPGHVAPAGAYALVGMGAMVAATTHAPITAILILFELTNDYRIMLPLMTSCIFATLVATWCSQESIYTKKLMRRGVNVRAGQDVDVLRNISVRDVVRRDMVTVRPSVCLEELVSRLSDSLEPCFYVTEDGERLLGVISFRELRHVLEDADILRHVVVAHDLADTSFLSVSIDDSLGSVLTRLDHGYRDELPVLDGDRLVGVARVSDVLARYRLEIAKRQVAQGASRPS